MGPSYMTLIKLRILELGPSEHSKPWSIVTGLVLLGLGLARTEGSSHDVSTSSLEIGCFSWLVYNEIVEGLFEIALQDALHQPGPLASLRTYRFKEVVSSIGLLNGSSLKTLTSLSQGFMFRGSDEGKDAYGMRPVVLISRISDVAKPNIRRRLRLEAFHEISYSMNMRRFTGFMKLKS
ncbi:hypothetical protein VNO77_15206 [Canavalia gladiata]|uniref:Uncharacterized protein n=1 Tax=Canavalia gladiata TaxID=3824 RepID=A0AAN9M3S0_CANGL